MRTQESSIIILILSLLSGVSLLFGSDTGIGSVDSHKFQTSDGIEVTKILQLNDDRTLSNIAYNSGQLFYFGERGLIRYNLSKQNELLLVDLKTTTVTIRYAVDKDVIVNKGAGIKLGRFGLGYVGTVSVSHSGNQIAYSANYNTPEDERFSTHESVYIYDTVNNRVAEMFTNIKQERLHVKLATMDGSEKYFDETNFKFEQYKPIGWTNDDLKVIYQADKVDRSGSAIMAFDLESNSERIIDEGEILVVSIDNTGNQLLYSKIENRQIKLITIDLLSNKRNTYIITLIRPIWGFDGHDVFEAGDRILALIDPQGSNYKVIFNFEQSIYDFQDYKNEDGKSRKIKMYMNDAIWPEKNKIFYLSNGYIFEMDLK